MENGFIEAAVKGVGSEEFNFQTRRDEEGAKIPRDLGTHKEIAGQPGAEGECPGPTGIRKSAHILKEAPVGKSSGKSNDRSVEEQVESVPFQAVLRSRSRHVEGGK